jgi:signal transduction histidine kinase
VTDAHGSIFVRLLRRALLLALVALALLLGVTAWESWNATERALAATVDTDVAGLVDIYASGGEGELLARLDDRATVISMSGRQAHYLVARPDGTVLGGNVRHWPALGAGLSEAGFITLADGTQVYARATRLAPDLDLLVGRTYEADRAALLRLVGMFAITAALIVLAVWLLGRVAAQNLRQRIGAISTALRAFEDGREAELHESEADDEIGELALLSGRAITRSAGLARTHRHMADHIAHEIRTPLTHLDARLVNALRNLPDGADPLMIEQCRRDIRGVVTMLDSLLDIASSEARVGDLSGLSEVNLSALATDLADLYAGSAEEQGITLRTVIASQVVLMGEPMQLTRLLSNLLDNALKYVPSGGQVTLLVSPGPVIEVRDDGPGIEPMLRPLVFERFRTGQVTNGKSSHGLGLALARAIALRHGLGIALADSLVGAHFVIKPHALWEAGDAKP